jgi:hypothetical protein
VEPLLDRSSRVGRRLQSADPGLGGVRAAKRRLSALEKGEKTKNGRKR